MVGASLPGDGGGVRSRREGDQAVDHHIHRDGGDAEILQFVRQVSRVPAAQTLLAGRSRGWELWGPAGDGFRIAGLGQRPDVSTVLADELPARGEPVVVQSVPVAVAGKIHLESPVRRRGDFREGFPAAGVVHQHVHGDVRQMETAGWHVHAALDADRVFSHGNLRDLGGGGLAEIGLQGIPGGRRGGGGFRGVELARHLRPEPHVAKLEHAVRGQRQVQPQFLPSAGQRLVAGGDACRVAFPCLAVIQRRDHARGSRFKRRAGKHREIRHASYAEILELQHLLRRVRHGGGCGPHGHGTADLHGAAGFPEGVRRTVEALQLQGRGGHQCGNAGKNEEAEVTRELFHGVGSGRGIMKRA
jgi:hypothetical protein